MHKRLKLFRDAKGLTQKELARKANLSVSTISQMESGAKKITQPSFDAVLNALGITPVEYFSPIPLDDLNRLTHIKDIVNSDNPLIREFFFAIVAGLKHLLESNSSSTQDVISAMSTMTVRLDKRLAKLEKLKKSNK